MQKRPSASTQFAAHMLSRMTREQAIVFFTLWLISQQLKKNDPREVYTLTNITSATLEMLMALGEYRGRANAENMVHQAMGLSVEARLVRLIPGMYRIKHTTLHENSLPVTEKLLSDAERHKMCEAAPRAFKVFRRVSPVLT